jgi:hypothetical protein
MEQNPLYDLHGLLWEFSMTLENEGWNDEYIQDVYRVTEHVERYMRSMQEELD